MTSVERRRLVRQHRTLICRGGLGCYILVATGIFEAEGQKMKRAAWLLVGRVLLVAGTAFSAIARADFELTGPDGRRFLLKDNGTWQALEALGKDQAGEGLAASDQALLLLEGKMDRGNGCRYAVQLVNNLPYEIRSFVPQFSAYRANGVHYDTVSVGSSFAVLRPGDKQTREFEIIGLTCQEIARLQVVGGDRCVMGDLDKFAPATGQCLARVRVVKSDLVRFDK